MFVTVNNDRRKGLYFYLRERKKERLSTKIYLFHYSRIKIFTKSRQKWKFRKLWPDRPSPLVRSAFGHTMDNLVWADIYVRVQHVSIQNASATARTMLVTAENYPPWNLFS